MMHPSEDSPAVPSAPPHGTLQTSDLQSPLATAIEQLPSMLATLASLHTTREPLAAALNTVDNEIARIMTLAHQAMSAIGARNFATATHVLQLKKKIVYKATDWDALYKHVTATGEFDLLHRRLSSTALQQRTELPPGVMQAAFDEPQFDAVKAGR